jgi:hypothetical protein
VGGLWVPKPSVPALRACGLVCLVLCLVRDCGDFELSTASCTPLGLPVVALWSVVLPNCTHCYHVCCCCCCRVMVLDQGELREFDSPAKLLTRPGGVFRGLMEEAGRWVMMRSIKYVTCHVSCLYS